MVGRSLLATLALGSSLLLGGPARAYDLFPFGFDRALKWGDDQLGRPGGGVIWSLMADDTPFGPSSRARAGAAPAISRSTAAVVVGWIRMRTVERRSRACRSPTTSRRSRRSTVYRLLEPPPAVLDPSAPSAKPDAVTLLERDALGGIDVMRDDQCAVVRQSEQEALMARSVAAVRGEALDFTDPSALRDVGPRAADGSGERGEGRFRPSAAAPQSPATSTSSSAFATISDSRSRSPAFSGVSASVASSRAASARTFSDAARSISLARAQPSTSTTTF